MFPIYKQITPNLTPCKVKQPKLITTSQKKISFTLNCPIIASGHERTASTLHYYIAIHDWTQLANKSYRQKFINFSTSSYDFCGIISHRREFLGNHHHHHHEWLLFYCCAYNAINAGH